MGCPLPKGYQFEGFGLEPVPWFLGALIVCEFMVFLDLARSTGSHPSFTLLGSSPAHTPGEFWVATASWKCIILSAHHQCLGETRDEGKGQQVAGESSMGLSFHVLVSLCCIWMGGRTQDLVLPLVPRILKLI